MKNVSIRTKSLGVKRGMQKGTHGKFGGPMEPPGGCLKSKPKLKGTATAKGKGPR